MLSWLKHWRLFLVGALLGTFVAIPIATSIFGSYPSPGRSLMMNAITLPIAVGFVALVLRHRRKQKEPDRVRLDKDDAA